MMWILGSLYVFDERVTMAYAAPTEREVIGVCECCGAPSEIYVNCADDERHRHFITCEECKFEGMFCRKGIHKGRTANGDSEKIEREILKEAEWAKKHGKRFSSAKEMIDDILR